MAQALIPYIPQGAQNQIRIAERGLNALRNLVQRRQRRRRRRPRAGPSRQNAQRQQTRALEARSGNPFVATVPMATTVRETVTRNGIRLRGTDLFRSVGVREDLIQTFAIDLSSLYTTRLGRYATMYQMWKVHNCSFQYVPTVAKTQPGTITLAPDYDPSEVTSLASSTEWAQRDLLAMTGARMLPVSDPGSISMRPIVPKTLYTDFVGDSRLTSYGQLKIITSGTTGLSDGDSLGHIAMSYDIEFLYRTLTHDEITWSDSTIEEFEIQIANAATVHVPGDTACFAANPTLIMQTAAHAAAPSMSSRLFRGTVNNNKTKTGTQARLVVDGTDTVNDGTVIYWTPAVSDFVPAGPSINPLSATSIAGRMWMGGPNQTWRRLGFIGNSAGRIELVGVQYTENRTL